LLLWWKIQEGRFCGGEKKGEERQAFLEGKKKIGQIQPSHQGVSFRLSGF
jgi:hypothetical protein